jgi:hypothetical protein
MQWKAVSQAAKNGYSHLNASQQQTNRSIAPLTCRAWTRYPQYACDAIPKKTRDQLGGRAELKGYTYSISDVFPFGRWRRLSWITLHPFFLNELVILLRPQHATQRLPHDLL